MQTQTYGFTTQCKQLGLPDEAGRGELVIMGKLVE
jgi:hypothetical protein